MIRNDRRTLLSFLAASPVLAGLLPFAKAFAAEHPLASAADALDVFELRDAARRLDLELRLAMAGCGARSVREISAGSLIESARGMAAG